MSELRDVISEVRETSTFEPDSEYAATVHWSGVARLLADELESLLDRVETAEQAIARVREQHVRTAFDDVPTEFHCKPCQITAGTWPCPTIKALEGDE